MKRGILFLSASLIFFVTAYAQSLSLSWTGGAISNGQTITYVGDTVATVYSYVTCTNNGLDSIDVKIKKIELSLIPGSENSYCWLNCYLPNVYVSTYSINMAPGAVSTDFSGEYKAHGNLGLSSVMYVFYDMNDINDSISVIIDYDCSMGSAVAEMPEENLEFSNAYPNPAQNYTSFSYALPASSTQQYRLVIRNLVGNIVAEKPIQDKYGVMKISTAELRDGVYFYSLLVDEVPFSTRKLVVKH